MSDVAQMTWQPIETTPKDGTIVLFWADRYYINRADDYWNKGMWLEKATHWSPLPEPPKLRHKLEFVP